MAGGGVMVFVQHLRGIGHLQRAAALCRAMVREGIPVDLVSGGMPVPDIDCTGVTLHQLAPLRSPDDSYTRLVDGEGREADAALRRRRREMLLGILQAARPGAVLVEMFPFGRSQIKDEMTALIAAARALTPQPLVISSVRDIVAAKRSAARYAEMADQVLAWFDAVLVHGDEGLLPFGESFPPAARIAEKLHYTGYVLAEEPPEPPAGDSREVLVSAGGGAFGAALMRNALAARSGGLLDPALAAAPWRLLTGPNIPAAEAQALRAQAGDDTAGDTVIETMRGDFRRLLAAARLSVSLCGYNTAMETLAAGTPAVMVAHGTGRQTEQRTRAAALQRRGLAETLTEAALTPARLAAAMNAAAHRRRGPAAPAIDLGGAQASAQRLKAWLAAGAAAPAQPAAAPA